VGGIGPGVGGSERGRPDPSGATDADPVVAALELEEAESGLEGGDALAVGGVAEVLTAGACDDDVGPDLAEGGEPDPTLEGGAAPGVAGFAEREGGFGE